MIFHKKELTSTAITKAWRLRKVCGLSLDTPVNIYDFSTSQGLEVKFIDIEAMEGIYLLADKPTIMVSSLRPAGRQAFTCAHELGHHVFGHGEQYDELVEQREPGRQFDPIEYQADCFAGALLMPKVQFYMPSISGA